MARRAPVHSALILLLGLTGCNAARQQMMTWPEYSRLRPELPYILRLNGPRGALLYFGARHTFDPADSQVAQIQREWETFRPEIVFTEGGLPPIAKSQNEAVRNAGEPGLVRFFAARDNVPTTTLDPSRAQEVAALSRTFSREQIKMFFTVRAVSQYVQRAGKAGLTTEVNRVLGIFGGTPGLTNAPRTIEELDASYRRSFPDDGSYEDVPASRFDPVLTGTFLNDISRASSDYRDTYMVQLLAQHVSEGQRVFAVVGGTHVVMQERVLRARIGALQ
jgi:hypothetical protein